MRERTSERPSHGGPSAHGGSPTRQHPSTHRVSVVRSVPLVSSVENAGRFRVRRFVGFHLAHLWELCRWPLLIPCPGLNIDNTIPDSEQDGLQAGIDAELAEDIDHMRADGLMADAQLIGDALVGQPL